MTEQYNTYPSFGAKETNPQNPPAPLETIPASPNTKIFHHVPTKSGCSQTQKKPLYCPFTMILRILPPSLSS